MPTFFLCHSAIAGGGRGASSSCAAAKGLFRWTGQRAEAHARDGDRNIQLNWTFGEACAERNGGLTLLSIAFERVAGDRRAQKQQVVKVWNPALRTAASNIVDAGGGCAANFTVRAVVKRRRLHGRGLRDLFIRHR